MCRTSALGIEPAAESLSLCSIKAFCCDDVGGSPLSDSTRFIRWEIVSLRAFGLGDVTVLEVLAGYFELLLP